MAWKVELKRNGVWHTERIFDKEQDALNLERIIWENYRSGLCGPSEFFRAETRVTKESYNGLD